MKENWKLTTFSTKVGNSDPLSGNHLLNSMTIIYKTLCREMNVVPLCVHVCATAVKQNDVGKF
jgi:hypothetical protein